MVPEGVLWPGRRGWMWSRVLGEGETVRREEEVRRHVGHPFRLGRRRASGESGWIGRHSGIDVIGYVWPLLSRIRLGLPLDG